MTKDERRARVEAKMAARFDAHRPVMPLPGVGRLALFASAVALVPVSHVEVPPTD